jgi:hypothetical protein
MTGYLQRMAVNVAKPGRSIQPVLGPLFSPSNFTADPVSIETEEQFTVSVPTEFAPRTKPQPSLDLPDASALQAPESSPKQERPAGSTESTPPIPVVLAPSPQQKEEPFIVPRLAQRRSHQRTEEPAKAQHETAGAQKIRTVEDQAIDTAPRESATLAKSTTPVFVRLLTPLLPIPQETKARVIVPRLPENRGDQSQERQAKPTNENRVPPPPKQEISFEEIKPNAIATGEDFRPSAAPTLTPTFGSAKNARTGSQSGYTARTEPDEIQIHIGRIEVVAVPPATVAPGSPKPKRETPSLDEYLRRRGGRSL